MTKINNIWKFSEDGRFIRFPVCVKVTNGGYDSYFDHMKTEKVLRNNLRRVYMLLTLSKHVAATGKQPEAVFLAHFVPGTWISVFNQTKPRRSSWWCGDSEVTLGKVVRNPSLRLSWPSTFLKLPQLASHRFVWLCLQHFIFRFYLSESNHPHMANHYPKCWLGKSIRLGHYIPFFMAKNHLLIAF